MINGASAQNCFLVNAAAGALTVTLPTASTVPGKIYVLKRLDKMANTVTIASAGGTVEGAATQSLKGVGTSFVLVSDGSAWWIIASH